MADLTTDGDPFPYLVMVAPSLLLSGLLFAAAVDTCQRLYEPEPVVCTACLKHHEPDECQRYCKEVDRD